MKITLITACFAAVLLMTAGTEASPGKKPDSGERGQSAIIKAPSAAERADLILSGANKAPNAWSAYIVRLADAPVARYRGEIRGLAPTNPAVTGSRKVDVRSPAGVAYSDYLLERQREFLSAAEKTLGRQIDVMNSYRFAINGLGLWLRNDEASQLAYLKDVVSVEQEEVRPLMTDAGPEWIGADAIWDGSGTVDLAGSKGEGIIIGVIDSGVNTDHPSFADVGPVDNYDHVNPHPSGEYQGVCEPTTGTPYCNDKLIGVYDCNAGGAGRALRLEANRVPMTFPLNGGTYGTGMCSTLDGPFTFPAGGVDITAAVADVIPANDLTAHIWFESESGPVKVADGDLLFSPETVTYAPNGGVPAGDYYVEVCPYQDSSILPPGTYTGTITWNDVGAGIGMACAGAAAEDANGHGSHTASTAGGNVVNADIVAPTITIQRTLSGVAPHANLITYAGCTPAGNCVSLSLVNAIEQTVIDGVDVVNYSIGGGPNNPWSDADAQAFLGAREAGIWVATSASNDGPGAGSIGSPADAPWITTVGASTHNRVLANNVQNLSGGDTSPPFTEILGKGLTGGYPATGTAPIIYAGDTPSNADVTADPALCAGGDIQAATNPWAANTFSGEIVVCDRGQFARVDKCTNVCDAGAGGCILANNAASGDSLVADGHTCPSVHITYDDGVLLKAWLNDGAGAGSHVGSIGGAYPDLAPINGDVQAGFSSRGPNRSAQNNLKPDVTNPGVDILAAVHTVGNTGPAPEFGSISGTSMSSPHTAGSFALLRAKRPEFSPSEAQSALMMTSTRTLTRDSNGADFGDPFDRGAGRVDLNQAARAAMVMHVDNYGSGPADAKGLNIPSFADTNCQSTCTWQRTVKSAATENIEWTADYFSEDGVVVTVTPSSFTLVPGGTQMISVTADIAAAVHATPQGTPGPNDENETQDLDTDGLIVFNACTGAAGDSKDCWVFADVVLTPSTAVPAVSMPIAARSTGDADGDGVKDLVDNCPTFNSTDTDQTDLDGDGVGDICDNCTGLANASQCDTNGDGYGNHCDADLNNNLIINSFDLTILRQNFGQSGENDADLNCDGIVNTFDLSILRQNFGGQPGPSALTP